MEIKREDIIKALKAYFNVKELVCPHTHQKYGEGSWRFLDTTFLQCLLILRRDILRVPLLVNNGTTLTQRGLRCNLCELVKSKTSLYLTAHAFGKGIDFSSSQMTAEQMRKVIIANADKLPVPFRLESGVNWVHFDIMPFDGGGKYYIFKG